MGVKPRIGMSMRISLLSVLLLVGAFGLYAQSYDEGLTAYNQGNYKVAFQTWKQLADKGDPAAEYALGVLYSNGQGVPKDEAVGFSWYLKAAEKGYPDAEYNVAIAYYNGQGVEKDYSTAFSWFLKAGDQGVVEAEYDLGVMYLQGKGVPQDYVSAVKWLQDAADQGNPSAQYNLGLMYQNGEGVSQNYVEAHMWFNLAASRFPASEKSNRDNAVTARDNLAKLMTSEQIAQAQKLASEWKPVTEPAGPFGTNAGLTVAKDTVVTLNYTGTLADGTVFDTSIGKPPLTFVEGEGHMIPGFEKGIMGMKAGQSKTFTIPASEAYGEPNKNLVVGVPKNQFPKDMVLKVGERVARQTSQGPIPGVITAIGSDTVTVDFNSPLAGKDLTFTVEIISVLKATPAEIAGKTGPAATTGNKALGENK